MAFSYTIKKQTYWGDLKVVIGTFTNGASDTGGDIDTGLNTVYYFNAQHTGSSVVSDAPVVNETFPCGGTVTIVTAADADGIWIAVGV